MTTALRFYLHYLANESLRDRVIANEDEGLTHFGIAAGSTRHGNLVSLEKDRIRPELVKDLDRLLAQGTEAVVNFLFDVLDELGLDLDRAKHLIRDDQHECKGNPPTPASASILRRSGYGAGEVHIRKLRPLEDLKAGRIGTVEISGQGFPPRTEVAFTTGADPDAQTPNASIVARRADMDVHQYMTVSYRFPATGDYHAWVKHQDGAWRPSNCTVHVAA